MLLLQIQFDTSRFHSFIYQAYRKETKTHCSYKRYNRVPFCVMEAPEILLKPPWVTHRRCFWNAYGNVASGGLPYHRTSAWDFFKAPWKMWNFGEKFRWIFFHQIFLCYSLQFNYILDLLEAVKSFHRHISSSKWHFKRG